MKLYIAIHNELMKFTSIIWLGSATYSLIDLTNINYSMKPMPEIKDTFILCIYIHTQKRQHIHTYTYTHTHT